MKKDTKEITINFVKDADVIYDKNKKLITMGMLLTIVIALTCLFPIFQEVLALGEVDSVIIPSGTSKLLRCEKKENGVNTVINMTYEDDNLYHYDVEYEFELDKLNYKEKNNLMSRFDVIENRILKFQNEAGFFYKHTKDSDKNGNILNLNLGYTISLKAVVNEKILELINGITMSFDEKSKSMISDGYICN